MYKALILDNAYFDGGKDGKLLARPGDDVDSLILEPWPNNPDNVQINITREELLAMLDLLPE